MNIKQRLAVMRFLISTVLVTAAVLPVYTTSTGNLAAQEMSAAGGAGEAPVTFDQVRSVLRKRCYTCHNQDELRGDFNVASLDTIMAGSGSGPAVIPGKPNESTLYTLSAHLEEPLMPPNSPKIPGRELDLIKRWIEGLAVEETEKKEGDSEREMGTAQSQVNETDADTSSSGDDVDTVTGIRPLLQPTAIAAIASHPQQPIVAIPGNGQAVIADIETGKWIRAFEFPEGEVTALRFSQDGETLLVAGGVAGLSGTVIGYDVSSGEKKFQVADEPDTVLAVDISKDGNLVAVGGPKKVVRIYSVSTGEAIHTLRKHTDWVLALEFSPDGLLLASADRFGGVFVWNPENGELFHTLIGHQGPVHAVAWDASGETLITGCEDGKARIWNMHHGDMTAAWDGGVGAILCVSHADRSGTLLGGRQKLAKLWKGPELAALEIPAQDEVVEVASDANGANLVMANAAGQVAVFDANSGEVQHRLILPVKQSGVDSLFAKLTLMERDYAETMRQERARLEAERSIAAERVETTEPNSSSYAESGVLRTNLAATLKSVEELQQQIVMVAKESQSAAKEVSVLRMEMTVLAKKMAAAEERASQMVKKHAALVEQSQIAVESLQDLYTSTMSEEELEQRLDTEKKLLDDAEAMLKTVDGQLQGQSSEIGSLLETVRDRLRERIESASNVIKK